MTKIELMQLQQVVIMMDFRVLASMMYKFFDKKIKSETKPNANEVLAQELHKPVIKKFKIIKVFARFTDNLCSGDLAEMT